jgi:hypothetical protein
MIRHSVVIILAVTCTCILQSGGAFAEPLSAEEFRQELVGLPLCGTPKTGALAGKTVCTLHLADGSAVLAGAGLLVRGSWEAEGRKICRRTANDPLDRRRCVEYERMGPQRYSNSDGVEFCVGPCGE